MDFRGRVWKMTCFGLKQGQHLENRAAHPRQCFFGVPSPPPPSLVLLTIFFFFRLAVCVFHILL